MANTHSLTLNGSSQSLSTGSTIDLTGVNKVTVDFEIKMASLPGSDAIVFEFSDNYNSVTTGFLVAFEGSQLAVSMRGDAVDYNKAVYSSAVHGLGDGGWHRVRAVFDKSLSTNEVSLYVDGNLKTPTSRPANGNNTNNFGNHTLYIGARHNDSYWTAMQIDDIRIWTDTITASTYDANQLIGTEANLLNYWKLNNSYTDSTVRANTLSATGSPAFSNSDFPTLTDLASSQALFFSQF